MVTIYNIISLIPWLESETQTSHNTSDNVELLRDTLNIGRCSKDIPYEITGKIKHLTSSATRVAIRSDIRQSVDTGRCAPCCSSDPTGIIARRVLLRSLRNS